jgi:hypothetical protein
MLGTFSTHPLENILMSMKKGITINSFERLPENINVQLSHDYKNQTTDKKKGQRMAFWSGRY